MSLDDRCQQFHEAALGTGKSKSPAREIATLRKFLHRNQDQRFSDKATARLFDTIQVYVVQKPTIREGSDGGKDDSGNGNGNNDGVHIDLKEGLLEDSLKMPFTVFSTKQKQKMIKWLEDIRGTTGTTTTSTAAGGTNSSDTWKRCVLSVIDIDGTSMTLMSDDTGDTYENVPLKNDDDQGKAIRTAFDSTDGVVSVEVLINENDKIQTIERVLVDDD